MDSAKIAALGDYGRLAGEDLLTFDMDEHRWRRFLTTYDKIEELVGSVHDAWFGTTILKGEAMSEFLARYASNPERSYGGRSGNSPALVSEMARRVEQIATLGGQWQAQPLQPTPVIPKPRSAMRIRPKE